jgi:uncharacterized protein YndB with AHSA1/START domain
MSELRLTKTPAVDVGLVIRRPAAEVFRAFADPDVTTRFWFTKSSGKLTPGAQVRWTWEMFDLSSPVVVKEVEEDERILFDWDDPAKTVDLRFTPVAGDATYVRVTETGHRGDGDEIVAQVIDSTSGFVQVLCACKALLEHDVELTVVRDHLLETPEV